MDKERLEKAMRINGEIESLSDRKRRLSANAYPSSLLEIKVNQCYGDFGKSFTNKEEFKGDIADEIYSAVMNIIDNRVAQLEKELQEL